MLGPYRSPRRFTYTRRQVWSGYAQAIEAAGFVPKPEFVAVIAAHGALETGHFQAGCWENNAGNVKPGTKWTGPYTCIVLNEDLPGRGLVWFSPEGELVGGRGSALKYPPRPVPPGHPQTQMRAYDTLAEGIADKIRFLQKPSYAFAMACAQRGDASGYVRAIRKNNYFTGYRDQPDPCQYELSVISIAKTYLELGLAVEAEQDLSPVCIEHFGTCEAERFDVDIIGAELRAQVAILHQQHLEDIVDDARRSR